MNRQKIPDTGPQGWVCPMCRRQFGRNRQSHDCAPAMSLDEYFETGPAHERPIFDAVMTALQGSDRVGPIHIEPVSVGIFLKRPRKFAELRPRDRWIAVSFSLHRTARHRTITRKVTPYGAWFHHVANVARPSDVDEALIALLVEAYELRTD